MNKLADVTVEAVVLLALIIVVGIVPEASSAAEVSFSVKKCEFSMLSWRAFHPESGDALSPDQRLIFSKQVDELFPGATQEEKKEIYKKINDAYERLEEGNAIDLSVVYEKTNYQPFSFCLEKDSFDQIEEILEAVRGIGQQLAIVAVSLSYVQWVILISLLLILLLLTFLAIAGFLFFRRRYSSDKPDLSNRESDRREKSPEIEDALATLKSVVEGRTSSMARNIGALTERVACLEREIADLRSLRSKASKVNQEPETDQVKAEVQFMTGSGTGFVDELLETGESNNRRSFDWEGATQRLVEQRGSDGEFLITSVQGQVVVLPRARRIQNQTDWYRVPGVFHYDNSRKGRLFIEKQPRLELQSDGSYALLEKGELVAHP